MVAKSVPKSSQNGNECRHSEKSRTDGSIVVPQRHLALISLSLGFLMIWTTVLTVILISHAFNDEMSSKETLHSFNNQKQMSRLVFIIGHEMVSTVDWLVSIGRRHHSLLTIDDAIGITWKMTDSVISEIKDETNGQRVQSVLALIRLVEVKLATFRGSVVSEQNPLSVIKFYDELCDTIERQTFGLDSMPSLASIRRQTPTGLMATTSYAMFVKGMSKRFAELSFGTVLVRSDLSVNKSDYFYYHFISGELIDNSFALNPRAQNRYLELQESDQTPDVLISLLDTDQRSGETRFANSYVNYVKNEIAILLRSKDFLDSGLWLEMSESSQIKHKMLCYHSAIALIAVFAIIACMSVLCSAFRHINAKQNAFSLRFDKSMSAFTVERNDNVYSLEFDDQINILSSNSYHKQMF